MPIARILINLSFINHQLLMKSDPVSPQGRKTIDIGELSLTIETPPDLDQLLIKAAEETPGEVDSIPYYSILWPSATGLAEYLSKKPALVKDRRVVELGCGLGLPSILCARLGGDVTATDFHPDNEEWLYHNAELNGVSLSYHQLDWNLFVAADPESPIEPAPLIIGSDLIYESIHIAALVCAINALCSSGGDVIIADPGRDNLPTFISSMEKSGWKHTLETENDIFILHFRRQI